MSSQSRCKPSRIQAEDAALFQLVLNEEVRRGLDRRV
jgi:hypothetical protein